MRVLWARFVRVARVRVGSRGAFSPAVARPELVRTGALQVVAIAASIPFAVSLGTGANPVLSLCADLVLAWGWGARRLLRAAIVRPFVAEEGADAYGQRSVRRRAGDADIGSKVVRDVEGGRTDAGECAETARHCDGPFEKMKGMGADIFKQQCTRQRDA